MRILPATVFVEDLEYGIHSQVVVTGDLRLGETGQTKDGYATQLTQEQLQKQKEGMANSV